MADFHLKKSDLLPVLEATLVDANRNPIDVSAATSIVFKMRILTSDPFIDITATVISGPAGRVDVPWASPDTDVPGNYKAMFKVTFPGPLVMSVPNKGCKTVLIEDDC